MDWTLIALISALFSALASIIEKKILFKERVAEFTAFLALINLILVIPFFLSIESIPSTTGLLVLFFKSLLNAIAFFCVMKAIKSLELSSALPLLVLTPGLVAIFASIFLKESLMLWQIVGLILLIIGTYALQIRKKQKFLDPFKILFKTKGYRYVITALLLFTITSILDKTILKVFKFPVNTFMAFQHLFFAIIFIAILFIFIKPKKIQVPSKSSWILLIILAIFTIIYRYAELTAMSMAPVALVLVLKRLSVLFSTIVGGKLFKESHLLLKTIATIIIIAGALLIILT
jgi:drug/metabolite transporter (DMT)-like permease